MFSCLQVDFCSPSPQTPHTLLPHSSTVYQDEAPRPITPTVFKGHQFKQICQFWNSKYRFATLYDTERRIPVYSAYTFSGQKESMNLSLSKNIRNEEWKNEPQVSEAAEFDCPFKKLHPIIMHNFFTNHLNESLSWMNRHQSLSHSIISFPTSHFSVCSVQVNIC